MADFFLCACGYVWVGPMWPKCASGDQKGLSWKEATSSGNPPIMGQRMWTFKNIVFILFTCMGQKGVFWIKKRCFRVFCTECEGADLKKRKKITIMDHRNKIRSLILPTDDPGDAQDYMCEYGPLAVNMAIYAIQHRPPRSICFHRHPSCI